MQSLPFAAAVAGTNGTRNWRSIEVSQELRVRYTHLKRQVLTQLKAIVTGRRGRVERNTLRLTSALYK